VTPDPPPDTKEHDRRLSACLDDYGHALQRMRGELDGFRAAVARFARYDESGRTSEALDGFSVLLLDNIGQVQRHLGRARDMLLADETKS